MTNEMLAEAFLAALRADLVTSWTVDAERAMLDVTAFGSSFSQYVQSGPTVRRVRVEFVWPDIPEAPPVSLPRRAINLRTP